MNPVNSVYGIRPDVIVGIPGRVVPRSVGRSSSSYRFIKFFGRDAIGAFDGRGGGC